MKHPTRFFWLALVVVSVFTPTKSDAIAADHFQVRDTADLVTLCLAEQGGPNYVEAISFCHGYGEGAWRYHLATLASHGVDFVCMPAKPEPMRGAVLRDFALWAQKHPDYMDDEATGTLFRYLELRFPCR